VVGVWMLAMRGGHERSGDLGEHHHLRWIIGGGIVLPTVAILALMVFGTPAGMHQLPLPASWSGQGGPAVAPLRVDVTARQWAWALHYPGSGVRLTNELRVPVGRPVDIHVRSDDVIHSFWVPRLGGKIDAIPGRTNVVRLQADEAGTFRGQCAEFCGLNHAHMVMSVIAMPQDEYDIWEMTREIAPARGAAQ
jgi:cytochrome c oxidase subunit 2